MSKKKEELFVDVKNTWDFKMALKNYQKKLVCAEIYLHNFGPCYALERPFYRKVKVHWDTQGIIAMLRVQCDEIEELERLRYSCEPFFMFLVYNKENKEWRVTSIFKGLDCIMFEQLIKKEITIFLKSMAGEPDERRTYALDEPLPEELEWLESAREEIKEEQLVVTNRKAIRHAERKRHRAELMVPHLRKLNFVLFWPHARHAHHELYEHWDEHNIIMVGREELQLDEEKAKDILYGGDAPINEASMHALLAGPALAICFRCLDDVDFIALVRHILYEQVFDEATGRSDKKSSTLQSTAFDHYKSYSPTKKQIWTKRREEKELRKIEKKHRRERLLSEKRRIARENIQDALKARKQEREEKKLELLKTGNLAELDKLKMEPELEEKDVDITIPEELSEPSEDESEVVEDEDEYFPPPGLLIPGFYSPPNEIAKANGLAVLFPRHVMENVIPQAEFLPPHVLVMIDMEKRHKAIAAIAPYKKAIINMGIFKTKSPYESEHVAYSVKQFDAMTNESYHLSDLKLCFMISTERDTAVLCLMDLYPSHVSRDDEAGEEECAAMFCVEYGDDYPQFEDFITNEDDDH